MPTGTTSSVLPVFDYTKYAPQLSKAKAISAVYLLLREYDPGADEEWLRKVAVRTIQKVKSPPKEKGPSFMEPPWWFKYGGMPTL